MDHLDALDAVKNALFSADGLCLNPDEDGVLITPRGAYSRVKFPEKSLAVAVFDQDGERRLWQSAYAQADCAAVSHLWISMPDGAFLHLAAQNAPLAVCREDLQATLAGRVRAQYFEGYPSMDAMGNRFEVDLNDGGETEKTLAAFYWHTMIPCIIEGKNEHYPDGYVLSTLAQSVYAGTYPDVDHEFQCKGRMACGDELDMQVVRRMIELQLRLMAEDPIGLWRNPCALQPNGVREYHVRRNSADNRTNADMFLISGNVEVLESAWLFIARCKDASWLARNIGSLEGAASLIELCMDPSGRLWSDVFYEDQIIKDGMECMSACLAAHGYRLLSQLEGFLGRRDKAAYYESLEKKLADMIARPVPHGFWDDQYQRFIDWLDRDGVVHDHIHLLANCLPVLFGYGTAEQRQACMDVIARHFDAFQRFPTFLSPRIEDYTPSEIGVPYDLCAAGRYWCWDAAYWAHLGRGDVVRDQVRRVSHQARLDGFEMGERYDMNHLYYIDDKNWHGASRYYEYPNVYWWVVIRELLGVRPSLTADMGLKPLCDRDCRFRLEAWGIACRCEEGAVTLTNLSTDKSLSVDFDPSLIWQGTSCEQIHLAPGETRTFSCPAHGSEG